MSGTSEEMKRTTRATSKRAAIDDTTRVAFPAAGSQQAKKRAALANLSNHHSSLPSSRTSSRNSSPVSDAHAKRRAALANLTNHSSTVAARNAASVSKIPAPGHAGAPKSKVLGGSSQTRNADVESSATQRRGRVGLNEKPQKISLGPSQIAADNRENQENVPPSTLQIDAPVKVPSRRAELRTDVKAPSRRAEVEIADKVASIKSGADLTGKANHLIVLPVAERQNSTAKNDAAVIASLERKTLENLYISRTTKVVLPQGASSSQGFTDIDCNQSDPQMCSIYAIDIYRHLRVQELKRRPTTEFMEVLQKDIDPTMRGTLIDWLVEVAEEYKLVPDTLYLTVSYIDRFLSINVVNRQRLQLLGVSCMLIAAKYEEICAPPVEEFCYITDNTYAREEVLEMERQVLTDLHFELTSPTTKSFLRRFIRAAQAGQSLSALQLEFLGNYLAELTLVEYKFLHYLPSVVAASAVFVARITLDGKNNPWDSTLRHYTGYRPSELKTCVTEIHELQWNTRNCGLPAIREKYSQHKFKCVATLTPVSIIPQQYFEDLES